MAEAWVRNPITCIRECAELLFPRLCWDRGYAHKNRLDPQKHIEIHYPSAVPYRLLMVGEQGTTELRRGSTMDEPYAVYPTWQYGVQTVPELEEMLAMPEDWNKTGPANERPVADQEHRVVIINPPNPRSAPGRALQSMLGELAEDYPGAIIHYHGTYSWRVAFGLGFGAADIDPVAEARRGRIMLASGRSIRWEEAPKYASWVTVHGVTFGELSVPRNRTMFNIKSALWAAENFTKEIAFRSRGSDAEVDPRAIKHEPQEVTYVYSPRQKANRGDKLACDHCSLAPTCKYYRHGGVCAIPDSDGSGLAKFFKTRDSDKIIEGLGKMMAQQSDRLERGIETEEYKNDGLDPEVTKLANFLFGSGVKLAKLVDPALAAAGANRIQINTNVNNGAIGSGPMTPAALMAQIVGELEAEGIAREDITPMMVAQHLAATNTKAIEANSTE